MARTGYSDAVPKDVTTALGDAVTIGQMSANTAQKIHNAFVELHDTQKKLQQARDDIRDLAENADASTREYLLGKSIASHEEAAEEAKSSFTKGFTAAGHVAAILEMFGHDLFHDESMKETPERFIKYLAEFHKGEPNVEAIFKQGFEADTAAGGIHGMVAQSNIPFRAVCEHHLLPMFGHAAIGYIPNQRVIGLSKLARIVDAYGTARPSLQERIAEKIADAFDRPPVAAKGVIVIIKAEHGCMACRGVNKPGVVTTTSVVRGVIRDVPAARQEFFNLINQ